MNDMRVVFYPYVVRPETGFILDRQWFRLQGEMERTKRPPSWPSLTVRLRVISRPDLLHDKLRSASDPARRPLHPFLDGNGRLGRAPPLDHL